MRTRVRAKYIIGYKDNDHVIYKDGEIVYEGDTIIFVGHDYSEEVDQTIDAGDSIVSPGLIDLNALGDIDHDLIHLEIPVVDKGVDMARILHHVIRQIGFVPGVLVAAVDDQRLFDTGLQRLGSAPQVQEHLRFMTDIHFHPGPSPVTNRTLTSPTWVESTNSKGAGSPPSSRHRPPCFPKPLRWPAGRA